MVLFKELYSKFRGQLQESWLTNEVTAQFGPDATLDSMFRYLWSRQETQQVLVPPSGNPGISRKGAIESEKFRNEGNRLYRERKLEQSLLAYNYAVLTAPHPELDSTEPPAPVHEGLALGMANRSAVLYEMGQFEAALADVERALTFGYPRTKIHKLHERQAKCLHALGRAQEARTVLEDTINSLPTLSLDEKETKVIKTSLTKLQSKCDSASSAGSTAQLYEKIFYRGPPQPPPVSSPGHDLPCMSDAIGIQYSPIRGRHLVAERDIQPGEVLVVEEALAATVKLDGTLRTHCSHCLRRSPMPLPCPSCSLVVFCSEHCRHQSLLRSHGAECGVLSALVALQLDPAPTLALRVLSATTLSALRTTVASIQQENVGTRPVLQVSSDYRALYHLQGHATARTESQLQEIAAVACVITHVLFECCPAFLKDENGQPTVVTEEDVMLVGGQLMRLILGLECNTHVTKEFEVVSQESVERKNRKRGREVGWSVYSALSLINHSCVPNALSTSHGSTKFLYSVSVIPRGAEVTDSYGERYVSHDRISRREGLQYHYFFCCGCAACQANWPLFHELPSKPSLRCPSCCQALMGFTCKICDLACTSKATTNTGVRLYDAPTVQIQLNKAWPLYVKAAMKVNLGKVDPDVITVVVDMLLLLDKYTVQPNQAYVTVQETLMVCYDLLGSVTLMPHNL
ncbi:hypothetical protein Pcinc_031813 [Petrolisthes cinctipes]|uniref:Protein-lysine N-methyltransferase SMYD4 n=1 Tax=Petrolisthes cinctipes TaxID=88211 RepID=A0AAE1EVM5_PETCI|nr:hypothetical protein Pcinc_031813 [Petrolisthes cinctipes]